MRLYYCEGLRNFGDAMNDWFWRELMPEVSWAEDGDLLLGIGTILDQRVPWARRRVVCGSGVGYGLLPAGIGEDPSWEIHGVRGPLSARVLGLAPEKALTDPAILLADFPEFRLAERSGVLFSPHWKTLWHGDWTRICQQAGVELLDVAAPSREVVRRIAGAKLVLAESMHAAIIADAFRVPWVAVAASHEFSTFKWADWALSLELNARAVCLPPSSPSAVLREALLPLSVHDYVKNWPPPKERRAGRATISLHGGEGGLDSAERALRRTLSREADPALKRRTRFIEAGLRRAALLNRRLEVSSAQAGRVAAILARLAGGPGQLSDEAVHLRALDRCREMVGQVRTRYARSHAAA